MNSLVAVYNVLTWCLIYVAYKSLLDEIRRNKGNKPE